MLLEWELTRKVFVAHNHEEVVHFPHIFQRLNSHQHEDISIRQHAISFTSNEVDIYNTVTRIK